MGFLLLYKIAKQNWLMFLCCCSKSRPTLASDNSNFNSYLVLGNILFGKD